MYPALLLCLLYLGSSAGTKDLSKRVVYAVNCGGPEHVGEGGIRYKADQPDPEAIDSDYGGRYYFANAHVKDRPLYQTERYSMDSFNYRFPAKDGNFVLMLKFSEVYFTHPGGKIFNVNLNGIPIVTNLDIFREAQAVGAAHDKYIEFKIGDGMLQAAGSKAAIDRFIEIELAKGPADNPKINAIAILSGGEAGLPELPVPLQPEEQEAEMPEEYTEDEHVDRWHQMGEVGHEEEPDADHSDFVSGPRAPNPFEQGNSYTLIIITALLVITIPMAFFLRNL